jgi:4-hydroxybenzoate polyprenyltransferase
VERASAIAAKPVALARASHPGPTVAVTAFSALLAASAGTPLRTGLVLVAAVLAGQLSIGWSNDRMDAARDRAVGRTDKPVAAGAISPGTVDAALAAAVLACIGLSLALGWRAGLTHLAAVACGWIYNAGLKSTVLSWLPYAVAFAALPAVATLALPTPTVPAGWVLVTGALLGCAGHLANAVPDLAEDDRTGVRGLPHRLRARGSLALAGLLLLAASVVVAFGPRRPPLPVSWVGLGVDILLILVALPAALRSPERRLAFHGILAIAGIDLALLLVTGRHLH